MIDDFQITQIENGTSTDYHEETFGILDVINPETTDIQIFLDLTIITPSVYASLVQNGLTTVNLLHEYATREPLENLSKVGRVNQRKLHEIIHYYYPTYNTENQELNMQLDPRDKKIIDVRFDGKRLTHFSNIGIHTFGDLIQFPEKILIQKVPRVNKITLQKVKTDYLDKYNLQFTTWKEWQKSGLDKLPSVYPTNGAYDIKFSLAFMQAGNKSLIDLKRLSLEDKINILRNNKITQDIGENIKRNYLAQLQEILGQLEI